jgi:phosphoribosyl 1,2-cyclic phosphate phosphodiesterase
LLKKKLLESNQKNMQIKILGCGPSTGVPMALAHWNNNNIDKNNPKNYRMRSSFFLQDGDKKLLVECGPEFREQTIKHNITHFDNVFISHKHKDHIDGIWELDQITKFVGKKTDIYCNKDTAENIKDKFDWLSTTSRNWGEIVEVEPYKIYDDLFILECLHGELETIGFRYKNFVFTPDLNVLPEKSRQYMKDADLWILQCNNITVNEYVLKYHTHLQQALDMIEELKPKRAILTHLTDEIDYESVSKILPKNAELAYDGMDITL